MARRKRKSTRRRSTRRHHTLAQLKGLKKATLVRIAHRCGG